MEPHERLDRALRKRRAELRIRTWRQLATKAGIAGETLRSVRAGDSRPSDATQAGLEEALEWAPGSIQAILEGGDPVPLTSRPGSFREEAAKVDEGLKELAAILEEALERQRGRPLTETQRRVTIEWTNSLERTIEAMDEEAG